MGSDNVEVLRSTLDELSHLFINPSRLTGQNKSKVAAGGYGEVWVATLDGSKKVAVKHLRIALPNVSKVRMATRLARELRVWARLKHQNVLKLDGYYLSDDYGTAQLISPYMTYGNVTDYMEGTKTNIEVRLKFVQGITSGMAYLHNCDPPICHGDLKPENVLISEEPSAVLCDFGLATVVQDPGDSTGLTTSRSLKGTTRYMSPELLQEGEGKHTLASDVWAWACTVFQILTNKAPYSTASGDGSIITAILQGSPPGPPGALGSLANKGDVPLQSSLKILQDLIPRCWEFKAEKRPSISLIDDRLHPAGPGEPYHTPTRPTEPDRDLSTAQMTPKTNYQPAESITNQSVSAAPAINPIDQQREKPGALRKSWISRVRSVLLPCL